MTAKKPKKRTAPKPIKPKQHRLLAIEAAMRELQMQIRALLNAQVGALTAQTQTREAISTLGPGLDRVERAIKQMLLEFPRVLAAHAAGINPADLQRALDAVGGKG